MNCPSCGEFVRAGVAFCPYCSARVTIVDAPPKPAPAPEQVTSQKTIRAAPKFIKCPHCGEETAESSIKCTACGGILSKAKNESPNQSLPQRRDPAIISGPVLICVKCGFSNIPEKRLCKNCGSSLYSESDAPPHADLDNSPVALEQRKSILDQEVVRQVRAGWVLITRTDTSAQMVSGRSGLLKSLVRRNESLYIEVDESGQIRHTKV
jgi:hypothetical protein